LTRGIFQLERRHLDLARDISAVARRHVAAAARAGAQEVQFATAAKPGDIDAGFWRAALGYAPLAEDNAVDRLGHGSTVWLQDLDEAKALRHAMHVDVSVARDHVQERVAAALAAGGRVVDESGAPAHWIFSDRAGNLWSREPVLAVAYDAMRIAPVSMQFVKDVLRLPSDTGWPAGVIGGRGIGVGPAGDWHGVLQVMGLIVAINGAGPRSAHQSSS